MSETWLKPSEEGLIETVLRSCPSIRNRDFCVFSKSRMHDARPDYHGRPYSGVAIICSSDSHFCYKELVSAWERFNAVMVSDHADIPIQVMVNVYMPFYQNGNSHQTETFVATIDALQGFIDKHGATAPVKVFSDMNVQLPQSHVLGKRWFKDKGFNIHSSILYDFMEYNGFVAADFLSKQDYDYTFFCHTNAHFTCIDHVLIPKHVILSCTPPFF